MEEVVEDEVEYESDPEEAKLSLKMRRREASDDEEERDGDGDGDDDEDGRDVKDMPPTRRIVDSDVESDGQGAAAEYEEEIEEDEEYDEEYVEELEEEGVLDEEEYEELLGQGDSGEVVDVVKAVAVTRESASGNKLGGDGGGSVDEYNEVHQEADASHPVGEEKKENEPFAVPTAGAFYMHDDRFRDNVGGRHRRTLGGRRLWESKDDKKWGHDKFEEMNMMERGHEKGRRILRGRYRGRGRNQGVDGGYLRGNRPKAYNSSSQNNAPNGVKGRGPRRYHSSMKNNDEATTQNKLPGKSNEKMPNSSLGKSYASTSNVEPDPVPTKKQAFASSLSSASPPFYPSGSSNKEIAVVQKRDAQAGGNNRNLKAMHADENFSTSRSNVVMRGKNVADSIGMDGLHIQESVSPAAGKLSTTMHLSSTRFPMMESSQMSQSRSQSRGSTLMGQMAYQPIALRGQVGRGSPTQVQNVQRSNAIRAQSSFQASGQQLPQHPGCGSEASSPKEALQIDSSECSELESPPGSSKSKTALVAKGKGNVQVGGRGSYLYSGAQVVGGSGNVSSHGDQNFPATRAFLPAVMPFGGQHAGGIGVRAVGMAFPGYVAQPQLGLGNSEMTWLPVLAGAAGALGATYCSPYIAVDGSYNAHPSNQGSSSSASSSKESNGNKPNNEWKPSQTPETSNDEFGPRQNKTRSRYTEMKFSPVK